MKLRAKSVLILLCAVSVIAAGQSSISNQGIAQETQARGYWIDPITKLMWTAKDNGKDISWRKAVKYCRNLRLAGDSDWRLAGIDELQGIYDKNAESPGLAGPGKGEAFPWHIKGGIFLTGDQWSSWRRLDDRGHPSGYVNYFDFNEGRPNDGPTGWPYPYAGRRALCVRRARE